MKKLFKSFIFLLLAFNTVNVTAQKISVWKSTDLDSFIKQTYKPTIINFWATFCKPCIEELPYFQQAAKKYDSAGLRLVLVSLDLKEAYPKKIQSFANKIKITSPLFFLDETNADIFCPIVDKSWSGAIPASLFINNKTGYRKFFEDQLSEKQLEEEIQKLLGNK